MIRWAAMAIVCSPEEQKRLTVTPATLTGNSPQYDLSSDVVAIRSFGIGAAHQHIFHLTRLQFAAPPRDSRHGHPSWHRGSC